MKNLWADLGDGSRVFRGLVSDISRSGLCISALPRLFSEKAGNLTIVVSGKDGRITMDLGLRWHAEGGKGTSLGCEIFRAPARWTEFVRDFEPAATAGKGSVSGL